MGALPRRPARRKGERPTIRYPQGGSESSSEEDMPSSHARYHGQRAWRRLRDRVPSLRGERPKARNHCRGEAGVRRCPRSVGFSAESPNTGSPVSENTPSRQWNVLKIAAKNPAAWTCPLSPTARALKKCE